MSAENVHVARVFENDGTPKMCRLLYRPEPTEREESPLSYSLFSSGEIWTSGAKSDSLSKAHPEVFARLSG